MRIGVDYRILAVGRELINRGMSRFTQQQLRAVLGVDDENQYVLLCLPGSDLTLIDPVIRRAPNVSIEHFPALDERDPTVGDPGTFLRRAEDYQQWIQRQGIDLYHSTTPFLVQDPLLVDFDVCPMVATFYDLIPYIFPAQYLSGWWREQYERTVTFLGRAERLIAISTSARDDAVTYMGFPPDRIDVVWPTPDESFRVLGRDVVDATLAGLRRRVDLPDDFLLTVSHLHHSKNLHTLLRAFALLSPAEREATPLVVCCHLDHHGLTYLRTLSDRFGVTDHVIPTGLVSDDELGALYNAALAVVHPSRYEGFGLPVVEAMRCGAPVITTTSSSLPEVAGDAGLLVDPDDAPGFADGVRSLVADPEQRLELSRRGREQSARFNTKQLATGTLATYRASLAPDGRDDGQPARPRLAVWAPFPPQQSGITDYNIELLQVLRHRYDVEVFVDDGFMPPPSLLRQYRVHHYTAFARRQEARPFDVSLYQMGGSLFHLYMYDALRSHPGVVVLHDLTWSHVLYTAALEAADLTRFRRQVEELEGEAAAGEWDALATVEPVLRQAAIDEFLAKWRMMRDVVSHSLTQVVHVEEAATELQRLYPDARPVVIPMGVADPYRSNPALEARVARRRQGVPDDAFVVGTFGIVHSFKRLEECLQAFAQLHARHPNARFVVVGRWLEDSYADHLRHRARALGVESSVRFTGHVSRRDLDDFLIASDVVLNLRLPVSRHMSATLARALAAAKPVIISDLEDWRFLPDDACLRVPVGAGEVPAVSEHLLALAADGGRRARLGAAARDYYEKEATIERMAARYSDVLDSHMRASVRHGMGVGDNHHAEDPSALPLNKPCELEDFSHPELVPVIRDVCGYKLSHLPAEFPHQAEHRKDWEVAMAVRAFRQLGVLHRDATLLGVAAGVEDTTFYLTRHVRQVFATDRYLDSGEWSTVAPLSMLADPQAVAPFDFDPNRLIVQHMDGRRLRYPDETFDGVFSSSSVEHFGDLQDVANAAYEMGRVLKPGGVLSLSTEIRLSGPPGGIGWPGMTLVFSPENLQRFIIDASGLEPVDELQTTVSDSTLATQRDITLAIQDHHAKVAAAGDEALDEYALWEFPHLVLVHEGYVFTSVHLALRKPEQYPRVPNEWAKPIPATVDAIDTYNRDLVHRTAGRMGAAAPPAESPAPGWYDHVDATRRAREDMDRDHQLLTEQVAKVDAYLAGLDRDLQAIQQWHEHAGLKVGQVSDLRDHIDHWAEEVAERLPPAGELAPEAEAHRVTLREGISFEVMLDSRADDQVTNFLRRGTSLDQHLLSLMLQFLRPGERLLDLGAHVGSFSLAAAAAGSPALAVDGSAENVALLRASAVRNGFTDLRVVHAVAGDEPGPVEFISNGPWGRVVTDDDSAPSVTVPGVTLLELVHAMGWQPLGFIKMDVEGSEIRVIRGMRALLELAGAPPVLYESNGHTLASYGLSPTELMGELEALGYSTYFVEPGRMVRVSADDMQPQTLADYLAVKRVPAGLEGFTIDGFMSREERVARVVADCTHHNEHHRIYMARALAEADEKLRSHPDVVEALEHLRSDPSAAVRAAAAWEETP
ncbi:MAG: FkbM family methyltransferase [Actinomycetota bacterium]|nr:FkbM family methyltransferase [Actinomycetota bacterium]